MTARVLGVDGGLNGLRIDSIIARVAIDENGNGVGLQHGGGGRYESDGGNDDFISRLYTNSPQCGFQRHRAIGNGNAVRGVLEGGKVALEPTHQGVVLILVAAPPPDAALQDALQQRVFLPAKDRPRDT